MPPDDAKTPVAKGAQRDIKSTPGDTLSWDRDDPAGSLQKLYEYVLAEANRSESWYWQRKRTKARGSQLIQWTAIALTSIAAIIPIALKMGFSHAMSEAIHVRDVIDPPDSGLLTSFLIALSAALIGFDRFAGLSSGWTRYVLAGTAIRSASEEFRMDWTALRSKLTTPPLSQDVGVMIERAKAFRLAVESLVAKETQDWATEFQNNVSQLEKELKVQFEQARANRVKAEEDLKAQIERESAARHAAEQPGSVEAIVMNAQDADDFQFRATLSTNQGVVVDEPVQGSRTWARVAVPPGSYKLTASAQMKKKSVVAMTVVAVKPGETAKVQIAFPQPSAGGPSA